MTSLWELKENEAQAIEQAFQRKNPPTIPVKQLPPAYDVVVNLVHTPAANQRDAVKMLWDAVKRGVANKTIPYQLLETACWIEHNGHFWKGFYDARDYAYDMKWVVEGEWVV